MAQRLAVLLTFLCGLSGFSRTVAAQHEPLFRSATNLVVVPVTVKDKSGHFVHGLDIDDFEIDEDGKKRNIVQFSAERVPASLGVLLDISGSMMSEPNARAVDDARWADTLRAFELLVTRLVPEDEIFLALFHERVVLAAAWTNEHPQILRAFSALRPGGRTALLNAVKSIVPAFQLARYQRKVLLLISDGQDSALPPWVPAPVYRYPPTRDQEIQAAQAQRYNMQREMMIGGAQDAVRRSGAMVYAIGMGTRKDARLNMEVLEALTLPSGGYVEPIRDPPEISSAVARICDDLQSQYLLAFEPAHNDAKLHKIAVKTRDRRLLVRARAGYMASGSREPTTGK